MIYFELLIILPTVATFRLGKWCPTEPARGVVGGPQILGQMMTSRTAINHTVHKHTGYQLLQVCRSVKACKGSIEKGYSEQHFPPHPCAGSSR